MIKENPDLTQCRSLYIWAILSKNLKLCKKYVLMMCCLALWLQK